MDTELDTRMGTRMGTIVETRMLLLVICTSTTSCMAIGTSMMDYQYMALSSRMNYHSQSRASSTARLVVCHTISNRRQVEPMCAAAVAAAREGGGGGVGEEGGGYQGHGDLPLRRHHS